MRNIIILFVFLILAVVFYMAYMRDAQLLNGYETKTIRIGNAELKVFVADTTEKRTQGLMNVSELTEDTGMLFVFPDAAPQTFWNKNTLIPLDLIWIADGRVVGISKLPSISESKDIVTVSSPGIAREVIEVSAGWAETHGTEIGDEVQYWQK